MFRPLLGIAAAGFVGVLLWKLLGVILLPMFASILGFVLLLVKLIFIIAAVWFVLALFKRRSGEARTD